MNCPICKKELEIKNKKVGENAAGEAIYNEFAICHDCKKQWNLDKQRAKSKDKKVKDVKTEDTKAKAEKAEPTQEHPQPARRVRKKRPANPDTISGTESEKKDNLKESVSLEERPHKKKRPVPSEGQEQPVRKVKKKRPVNPDTFSESSESSDKAAPAPKKKAPAANGQIRRVSSDMDIKDTRPKKKRPVKPLDNDFDDFSELSNTLEDDTHEKKYSNIPPKHIRETREKEMRENYQNMLDEDDDDDKGGAPIILILVIIIIILIIAAFAGYWFLLR